MKFVIDGRVTDAAQGGRTKHSHREQADQQIHSFFCLWGQDQQKGNGGKHKGAYIGCGQGVLEIPIVKAHIVIYDPRKPKVRNINQASEQNVEQPEIADIFHTTDTGRV